ncbi:MAG: 4a-hydroxytetrahydrobiopterin dehydratase [Planctomycetes bacterium]|nr:4a-hydroxytetrahydrobiopterin dehydratase [Planctomycetota bacterium]
MQCSLTNRSCVPCQGGVPPLDQEKIEPLLAELGNDWQVADGHHLEKTYKFKNFKQALAFVNRVGAAAEAEGHHPNICFTWGRVTLQLWTHKINGLHENDFILAAKADAALET